MRSRTRSPLPRWPSCAEVVHIQRKRRTNSQERTGAGHTPRMSGLVEDINFSNVIFWRLLGLLGGLSWGGLVASWGVFGDSWGLLGGSWRFLRPIKAYSLEMLIFPMDFFIF